MIRPQKLDSITQMDCIEHTPYDAMHFRLRILQTQKEVAQNHTVNE